MHKKDKLNNIKAGYLFVFFIFNIYNLTAQTVRINEVVSSNSVYLDEDGDTPDWLEIRNYGTQDVSINGWSLSDDVNDLTKWIFPDITLTPNQYMLLWASSKDRTTMSYTRTLVNEGDDFQYLIPTSEPNSNWKALSFNDTNWISAPSGFGYNDGDDATGIPIGTRSIYLRKKFTISNLSTITSLILDMDYDDAFVAYINGNEVARANINGTPPAYNSGTITDHEAQMYGGGLPERFLITDYNSILNEGENILTIQAHNISPGSSDFTIIPFLSADFSTPNNSGIEPPAILGLTNNLHTNFKISSSIETVSLTNTSGAIVHQIIAENLATDTSIGISTTSGEIVSYIETTPGYENSSQEYLGSIQSEVVFSHPGGLFNAPISLILSGNTSEELIRYTIGENNPTENSPIYTSPIQINEDTTVRAQMFLENYIPSPVNSKTYILNTGNNTFTNSNLPIVIINTENGAEIPNEPKILGTMKIIQRPNGARNFITDANNDEFLDYSGTIGIETRGSSSQELPKKPYGIDTLEDDGIEDENVELLGMPKENDWLLNSFAFDDSMMRDYISYEMARQMGQYATNIKYCEVVLNGEYIGLYALSEKIKRDGDRVDIAKLSDDENSLPEITGGYIIQTDRTGGDNPPEAWYNSGAGYIHEKPNSNDITSSQSQYIEAVFRDLDNNAINSNITSGYPSIIDVPSFVNYMLIAEIASNVDAYALSTYYHKDRSGKLRAGPVWDYNLTYGNDLFGFFNDYYDRSHTDVWQFEYENQGANFWKDLFANPTFKCYLSKRFNEVTNTGEPLNYDYISSLIDSTTALISEAVVRENEKWDTIDNFTGEIANIKSWIQERIAWMRSNLGAFTNCNNVETPSLVITKIHYNPQETVAFPESDDLEFIEIKNTGSTIVTLTGIYLIKLGVSYQFPQNSTIAAGEYIYLAGDATSFQNKYGIIPFDTFVRDLSNKSHNLVLSDAFGNLIDQVEYTDKEPWPESADGDGFYLQLIDINSDNSLAINWVASSSEVLSANGFNNSEVNFTVYPNPAEEKLMINSEQAIEKITIFNLLGQQIKTFQVDFKSGEINISKLNKGMYFLNLKLEDGASISTKIFKN